MTTSAEVGGRTENSRNRYSMLNDPMRDGMGEEEESKKKKRKEGIRREQLSCKTSLAQFEMNRGLESWSYC